MSDPTTVSRRLVAVFAADVEGYSRLMGADEVGTLKGLTERRAFGCELPNFRFPRDAAQGQAGCQGQLVVGAHFPA